MSAARGLSLGPAAPWMSSSTPVASNPDASHSCVSGQISPLASRLKCLISCCVVQPTCPDLSPLLLSQCSSLWVRCLEGRGPEGTRLRSPVTSLHIRSIAKPALHSWAPPLPSPGSDAVSCPPGPTAPAPALGSSSWRWLPGPSSPPSHLPPTADSELTTARATSGVPWTPVEHRAWVVFS